MRLPQPPPKCAFLPFETQGVLLLHGNRNVFHNDPNDPKVHRANIQPAFAQLFALVRDANVETGPTSTVIDAYLATAQVWGQQPMAIPVRATHRLLLLIPVRS